MTTDQWRQATLPIRLGGLGIQDPLSQRLAARVSAIMTFLKDGPRTLCINLDPSFMPSDCPDVVVSLHDQLGAVPPHQSWSSVGAILDTFTGAQNSQKWWGDRLAIAAQAKFTSTLSDAELVRFSCQTIPHAMSWLAVIPCPAKRTLLGTVEFRCLLRWSLGQPVMAEAPPGQSAACPRCLTPVPTTGHHFVCCTQNNITRRHHVVVEALAQVVRQAGYPCKKEQSAPDRTRPGDLFVSRLTADGPGAIDVTVRDPLAPSHPCTAGSIGCWHEAQESQKLTKYHATCARLGWTLRPFVLDVFGGFGPDARALMGTLLKGLLGQHEAWQRRAVEASAWQRITFALMAEVGKQLVWCVRAEVGDPAGQPDLHNPYS